MSNMRVKLRFGLLAFLLVVTAPFAQALPEGAVRALTLAPTEASPRNSEGDFIGLRDGRILFVYTRFMSGSDDFDQAHLAARESRDDGRTWSPVDTNVLSNEGGLNTMSVSLLRLQDGRIAMLYLRKDGKDVCMPLIRFSSDEAATWSEPVACVTSGPGYYVVNNDRLVQLESGRLVVPAARHTVGGVPFVERAAALCLLSDDGGLSWRPSTTTLEAPPDIATGLQEPGVVQLEDGSLLMFSRTSGGAQYFSRSRDGGDTWTEAKPGPLVSPVSPASIERLPGTGDLVAFWNDHSSIAPELVGKRTPLSMAISTDGGETWSPSRTLEDNPHGWYCYTAVHFTEEAVLLGYCAGDRRENNGLALTEVLRLPLEWVRKQAAEISR